MRNTLRILVLTLAAATRAFGATEAAPPAFELRADPQLEILSAGRSRAEWAAEAERGAVSDAELRLGDAWHLDVPNEEFLLPDTGTVEFHFRTDWDSDDNLRHTFLVDDRRSFRVFKFTNNTLYFQIPLHPRGQVSAAAPVAWSAGQWHRLAVVWEGAADADTPVRIAMYFDGRQVAQASGQGRARPIGDRLLFGSDTQERAPFEGAFRRVRISHEAERTLDAVPPPLPPVADEPYNSTTDYLPADATPDRHHGLRALLGVDLGAASAALVERVFGDRSGQRVIYRDSVTGAEVWILRRTSQDERVAYTNYYPFNADGSFIRVWGSSLRLRSDGSEAVRFSDLIPHRFRGLPEWSRTDPFTVLCGTAGGGEFLYSFRTGERTDLFLPDPDTPADTEIQFSEDRQHSFFLTRQGRPRPASFFLGDGRGETLVEIPYKTVSPAPEQDRMGTGAFLRDQHGTLYVRYSLNKGARGHAEETPYQNWLVSLDGQTFRRMNSQNAMLDGTPLYFRPAGSHVVTGHGGYSPSGTLFSHHAGRPGFKYVRDLATWSQRDIARIPGCDHMDWTVSDDWFFVWARQIGVPIYQVFLDSGFVHRIVASNSCAHDGRSNPYHGASPDGTKLLYSSSMLGNLDLYMAVVRYPAPPREVSLSPFRDGYRLAWQRPDPGREVRGFHVYRSGRSGLDYRRLTSAPVEGTEYVDAHAPPRAFYVLTSVEHSGLESRVFSNEVSTEPPAEVVLFVEAETADLAVPMRELFLPDGASAGYAIGRAHVDPFWEKTEGPGRASWRLPIPRSGEYRIQARLRSRQGIPQLLWVSAGGLPGRILSVERRDWHWMPLTPAVALDAGETRLEIALEESGIEIDRLLITTDPDLVPDGMGNTPGPAPGAPADLRVEQAADEPFMILRWTPVEDLMFHHYEVHRGDAPDFTPDPSTLIGSPDVPAFLDPVERAVPGTWYRVRAVNTWGVSGAFSRGATVGWAGDEAVFPEAVTRTIALNEARLEPPALQVREPSTGDTAVAFGQPDQEMEFAGKAVLPVELPPGTYYVWIRLKGSALKSGAFFWLTLGEARHYTMVSFAPDTFAESSEPTWFRMRSLPEAREDRTGEHPIAEFSVQGGPTDLVIEHRANYMLADRIFITDRADVLPPGETRAYHPGCPLAFPEP